MAQKQTLLCNFSIVFEPQMRTRVEFDRSKNKLELHLWMTPNCSENVFVIGESFGMRSVQSHQSGPVFRFWCVISP